eukprot:SAG25_NODE_1211_length_3595_cov_1.783181_1_plen_894_part_00
MNRQLRGRNDALNVSVTRNAGNLKYDLEGLKWSALKEEAFEHHGVQKEALRQFLSERREERREAAAGEGDDGGEGGASKQREPPPPPNPLLEESRTKQLRKAEREADKEDLIKLLMHQMQSTPTHFQVVWKQPTEAWRKHSHWEECQWMPSAEDGIARHRYKKVGLMPGTTYQYKLRFMYFGEHKDPWARGATYVVQTEGSAQTVESWPEYFARLGPAAIRRPAGVEDAAAPGPMGATAMLAEAAHGGHHMGGLGGTTPLQLAAVESAGGAGAAALVASQLRQVRQAPRGRGLADVIALSRRAALAAVVHDPDAALRKAVMKLDVEAAEAALQCGADPNCRIHFGRHKRRLAANASMQRLATPEGMPRAVGGLATSPSAHSILHPQTLSESTNYAHALLSTGSAALREFDQRANRVPLLQVCCRRIGPRVMSYTDPHVAAAMPYHRNHRRRLRHAGRRPYTDHIDEALALPVVKLLLQHEAEVDAVDREGNTALHEAARVEACGVIQLLLDAKADYHMANEHDETPFDVARGNGHQLAMAMLYHSVKERQYLSQAMQQFGGGSVLLSSGGRRHSSVESRELAAEDAAEAFKRLLGPSKQAERMIEFERAREAKEQQQQQEEAASRTQALLEEDAEQAIRLLPLGWTEHWDGGEQAMYYHHEERDITQWDRPTEEDETQLETVHSQATLLLLRSTREEAGGDSVVGDADTVTTGGSEPGEDASGAEGQSAGSAAAAAALPSSAPSSLPSLGSSSGLLGTGWAEHWDDEQQAPYYHHEERGITQWDRPTEGQVEQQQVAAGAGLLQSTSAGSAAAAAAAAGGEGAEAEAEAAPAEEEEPPSTLTGTSASTAATTEQAATETTRRTEEEKRALASALLDDMLDDAILRGATTRKGL